MAPSHEQTLRSLAIRVFGGMLLAVSGLIVVELGIEMAYSGLRPSEIMLQPGTASALASSVSRAVNNLTAMVLTFLALAIPITANLYTPRLIDIFVRDRVNLAALIYYAVMGAHAIFAQVLAGDGPVVIFVVVAASGIFGFVILVPYYLYVLHFLDPRTIIDNVKHRVIAAFQRAAARGDVARGERAVLHDKILDLGNVILRAIDRNDRNVSLDAIVALKDVVLRYHDMKARFSPGWFRIRSDLFVGLSPDAITAIESGRTWVEHKCLSQLSLAYNASLTKMKDAISAVADVNREIAQYANARDDIETVKLCLRFFNSFIREAIKGKDVHAVYDTFHQYKELAHGLLSTHPELVVQIGRHFRYYAEFARFQGLAFIYELTAYELSAIVEWAYEEKCPAAPDLLETLLAFGTRDASVRLAKAVALVGSSFEALGLEAETARVRDYLADVPAPIRARARKDIVETEDPVFWEVTDRQRNLDYVEPVRRARVARLLDGSPPELETSGVGAEGAPTRASNNRPEPGEEP